MTWYGGNDGGMLSPKKEGDLVRYDDGPSALMRITHVRFMGMEDVRGIGCHYRYMVAPFIVTALAQDVTTANAASQRLAILRLGKLAMTITTHGLEEC